MTYIITKTDGTTLVSIPDTQKNTDYGITLIGQNYSGYGVFLNDNFVSLLENFNKSTPPANVVEGQLWYNPSSYSISLWDDRAWKSLAFATASNNAPTSLGRNVGDMWYDTNNQQLNVWTGQLNVDTLSTASVSASTTVTVVTTDNVRVGDILTSGSITLSNNVLVSKILDSTNLLLSQPVTIGNGASITLIRSSGWYMIGPSYTRTQQKTGIFPVDITDTNAIPHTVGLLYQHGRIIGAVSRDNEFRPQTADAIDRLPIIRPGITLIEGSAPQFVRTVTASVVGSAGTTIVPISNVVDVALNDYVITANIDFSTQAGAQVQAIYPGNSSIQINRITTIASGELITFQRGTTEALQFHGTVSDAQMLGGATPDRYAMVDSDQTFQQDVAVDGNLYVVDFQLWDNNGDLNLTNQKRGGDFNFWANITGTSLTRSLYVNGGYGNVEVAMDPTSLTGVATKRYVDNSQGVALSALTANVVALIGTAPVGRRDFGGVSIILDAYATNFSTVFSALDTKSPIYSPTFIGAPSAPTPLVGDNTGNIATAFYVTRAVSNLEQATTANAVIQDSQILLRANIASPSFTGIPVTTDPADTDRTTRIATTAFVGRITETLNINITNALALKAPINNAAFTGSMFAPEPVEQLTFSQPLGTTDPIGITVFGGTVDVATTSFVANALMHMPSTNVAPYATRVSPTFEGIPRAATARADLAGFVANTQLATTQFVMSYSPVLSVAGKTGTVTLAVADITGAAPTSSPSFTGSPVTVKPAYDSNNTSIPTTSWVRDITDILAPQVNPVFTGKISMTNPSSTSNEAIATTCNWVNNLLAQPTTTVALWAGATKFVSSAAPQDTQGIDGDIWFQYTV